MYCSRPVARSPSVVRVVRPGPKCGARSASFFPHQPSFFGRFPPSAVAGGNDFAPFFRLFDEFTNPTTNLFRNSTGAFQPRFDVREVDETYELRGELPGIEGKDIEVEFTDPQTLIIRGRTEKETSSGTAPTVESAEVTKEVADTDNSDDAASTYSTGSYQKASVEDEGADAAQATPAESTTEQGEKPTEEAKPTEGATAPSGRYWISERSTGSFQRVFNFQSRIDQDAVKATLKNGILSIVVPKAAVPAAKKISVE